MLPTARTTAFCQLFRRRHRLHPPDELPDAEECASALPPCAGAVEPDINEFSRHA